MNYLTFVFLLLVPLSAMADGFTFGLGMDVTHLQDNSYDEEIESRVYKGTYYTVRRRYTDGGFSNNKLLILGYNSGKNTGYLSTFTNSYGDPSKAIAFTRSSFLGLELGAAVVYGYKDMPRGAYHAEAKIKPKIAPIIVTPSINLFDVAEVKLLIMGPVVVTTLSTHL